MTYFMKNEKIFQTVRGDPACMMFRDVNGGEIGGCVITTGNVIKADDGDVTRNVKTALAEGAQRKEYLPAMSRAERRQR